MERLTKVYEEDNQKYVCIDVCGENCVENNTWCPKCKPFTDVMKKLSHYEDLEEQGLLLKLPCKVGDKVYVFWTSYNFKTEEVEHKIIVDVFEIEMMSEFGKTVFLTREEAEAKLQELQNGVTQSNDGVKEGK